MTKTQRERLQHLARECNSPKHQLMNILREVESISPAKARALDRAIAKIEAWQNKVSPC